MRRLELKLIIGVLIVIALLIGFKDSGTVYLGAGVSDNQPRVSTLNSSQDTLSDGGTYTGTWERVDKYDSILVRTYTDTDGTLQVQFDGDGQTPIDSTLSYEVDGSSKVEPPHRLIAGSRYFRVVYTDDSDGSTMSRFELITHLGDHSPITSALNFNIAQDSDAELVRSLPPLFDIARSKVQGITTINKFGEAVNGVQTSATDIWDRADETPTQQIWTHPTTTGALTIVSTDARDTSDGGGARTLRISGIQTWDSLRSSEDIVMNGTTGTTTLNTWQCVDRVEVLTSGGLSSPNAGAIQVLGNNGVMAQVAADAGQTQMAIFCLGSLQKAYLTQWSGSVNKASASGAHITFSLLVNAEPDVSTSTYNVKDIRGLQSTGNSSTVWGKQPYQVFTGPFVMKVQGVASANDIDATAGFGLIIEEN